MEGFMGIAIILLLAALLAWQDHSSQKRLESAWRESKLFQMAEEARRGETEEGGFGGD